MIGQPGTCGITDAGTHFRPHALRIIADVDEAGAALEGLGTVPAGSLTVSLPFTIATALVAPMLPAFMASYPQVRVVLVVENRYINMPAEPADLIIRVGPLVDSDLVARRLLVSETWLCASPDYLAARGTPITTADLSGHSLIGYHDRPTVYLDDAPSDAGRIELAPAIAISDAAALLPLALAGAGIAHLPDFLARSLVADGRLVRLKPTIAREQSVIHAVYPSHRSLSAKVRVFIDALAASVSHHTHCA